MKLFKQSWLIFAFLILLIFILALYPNGSVFMVVSALGSAAIAGFTYKVLKDDEPVVEGVDFD